MRGDGDGLAVDGAAIVLFNGRGGAYPARLRLQGRTARAEVLSFDPAERELYTPEDQAAGEPQRELDKARAEGSAPDRRWHLRRDGGRVFIDGSVQPLRGPAGQLDLLNEHLGRARVGREFLLHLIEGELIAGHYPDRVAA